jgi:competence protein ComEC
MKLPALAITVSFASGIALGLQAFVRENSSGRAEMFTGFALAALALLTAGLLASKGRLLAAGLLALFSWLTLGVLAARVAGQAKPADHVLALAESGAIDLNSPLRWHGRLRDAPVQLPWGWSYDLQLKSVEARGVLLPVSGGLRLSFSSGPEEHPPDLHLGDRVAVLAEARLPETFRDEGAFDRRAYLAQQNIDVIAALRAPELLELEAAGPSTLASRLARIRRSFRTELDTLLPRNPSCAGILRAMLLGDRSFVERPEALDFQKTGVFHVLVVAGLHVGAFAATLFWLGRRLKLTVIWIALCTIVLIAFYVAMVEQRPPVLRAALMTMAVALGRIFFRRVDLLNSAAMAALILLIAKPLELRDSSFHLTFIAIGCIAGLAAPWLERTVQPFLRALQGWREVARDTAHEPHIIQFRIDLRSALARLSAMLPGPFARPATGGLIAALRASLRVWELFILTLVLQIGLLPWMARDFHRVTLSGPFTNLVAVPLTGILVPLGFLTLIIGAAFPALGKILAGVLALLTSLLTAAVRWFAGLPHGSYRIPGPPLALTVIFAGLVVLLAATLRRSPPRRLKVPLSPVSWSRWLQGSALAAFLAVARMVALYPFPPKWNKGQLELTVLDVGQGDALFLVSPAGRTMLIDAGGALQAFGGRPQLNSVDPGEDAVSSYLWWRGFKHIDVVALTHAHQDHLGGMTAVLQNFSVGELWISREALSAALARLETLARERGIAIRTESRGQSFSWDGAEGQFFWPEADSARNPAPAANDDSLVLRLQYKGASLMLPGDAEKQAEYQMLSENPPESLRADVLKIGHHGSKNSSTPELLAAVRPHLALISAGRENPYGHPSPELLQRLEDAGVRVLRTDRNGAIHVLADGRQFRVTCFIPCPGNDFAPSRLEEAQSPGHQQHAQ